MCASRFQDYKTCIIDANDDIGAKIKISGGGKCNITNKYLDTKKYIGDKRFIDNILNKFDNTKLLEFLNNNNIFPTIKENLVKGAYFCQNSNEIVNMFKRLTSKSKYYLRYKIQDIDYENDMFQIKTDDKTIYAKKLIVASGGLSYPVLNASDIGYKIAQYFGHNVSRLTPVLVGWTIQKEQFAFKSLSGLSIKNVHITIGDKICQGGLLFTHKGLSGPAVLSASLYWNKGLISIDFKPYKNTYLPKRFRQLAKELNIDLHDYKMAPAGNFGFNKAEVTKGGVDTQEIDENMQSKKQKNLYFVGEVLDIAGELGGYNLQWAISSAYSVKF